MKKLWISVLVVAVLVIGAASFAFAAGVIQTPAEIVAGLTGQDVEAVAAARAEGATYGALAADAGKLEEFQAARLEQYKLRLDQAVADGRITQERADELYAAMVDRLENCDGDGSGYGPGNGICDGSCTGLGQGMAAGIGGFGRNGSTDGNGLDRGRGGMNCR